MNRTTVFTGVAALALLALGAIAFKSGNGASLGPPSGMGSAAPSAAPAVVLAAGPEAAPDRAGPLPPAMPTRTWAATVMTGGTALGVPFAPAQVAPTPALVLPAPAAAPGFNGSAAPPGPAPGLLPGAGPLPGDPMDTNTTATQAGPGPSQNRAAVVGPENEMATRAARARMAEAAGAPAPNAPADATQSNKDPLAGWGPPPAPTIDPRRFTEAHWQGLEVVPRTPALAKALQLPPGVPGVVVDDVTLPADLQGFQAGDLVTHVGQLPTPDLTSFIRATDLVRDQRSAQLDVLRDKQPVSTILTALLQRLGNANGETPSMIPPGARMPHEFRGPCTNCHRIGTTGTLAVDQGDAMTTTAPTIKVGARRPHRDRGPCLACHTVTP